MQSPKTSLLIGRSFLQPYSISLVVFDLDDTLFRGLDGGYICGVDYADDGRTDYTFTRLDESCLLRNDGQRFQVYAGVLPLLEELKRWGILISLASYNHPQPVYRALQAFGLFEYFQHPVVEWSGRKDRMIQRILSDFASEGYSIGPENTLFIDDDLPGHYRKQMAEIGVHFLQPGVDIQSLDEILKLPQFEWIRAVRA
jgi:magnesium-dependent phosphatase-1